MTTLGGKKLHFSAHSRLAISLALPEASEPRAQEGNDNAAWLGVKIEGGHGPQKEVIEWALYGTNSDGKNRFLFGRRGGYILISLVGLTRKANYGRLAQRFAAQCRPATSHKRGLLPFSVAMRTIALIPVYNEATTLIPVLEALTARVDSVLIVDDGSTDDSLALAQRWVRGRAGVEVLHLPSNRGMAAALREGFVRVAARLEDRELEPEDLLFTLDADGQHDSGQVAVLGAYMEKLDLDVALTQRDFALYPFHKRIGNRMMSAWGSLWAGYRYSDVESGFRAMRLRVIPPLLDYYSGCRYSCAQEIAVLTARLGFRVDNNFRTVVRLYRSQTRARDVLINGLFGFLAFIRWIFRLKVVTRPALASLVAASEPY